MLLVPWKLRNGFNLMNDACSKCYALSEHLAADDVGGG
jgi:hypothetical protein